VNDYDWLGNTGCYSGNRAFILLILNDMAKKVLKGGK